MNRHRCLIKSLALIFLCACALLSYALCYAQETAGPVEVNGDEVEFFPREKKVVGTGNVSVDYDDARLTCDKITVYTETKDAEAEGNVLLKTLTGEVRGEKIRYNFETKQGEVLEIRVKSGEWYAGGDKADLMPDGSIKIAESYVTSCDRERPHYKISSKNLVIYPDNKIVAKNVLFKVGNVPVAYLPRYDYSLDADWPTIDVIPGKKSKWGVFALTSYRYAIDEQNKITLRMDEREKWGFGSGLDYKYSFGDFGEGLLKTYFTHQRNRDRNEDGVLAEEERYMVKLRHRWDIDENITAFLEYHKMSDVDFTKDYFYREEYDRESSPESYLYLLDRQPEYSLSLLTRKRVNDFQTVIERLPEVRFNLKDQNLADSPIYFKTDTVITNLNSKTADNVSEDEAVVRFDTYNKLSAPLFIADTFSIVPFVGTRDTLYSRNAIGDDDEFRTAFYTGVDASTKLSKTYGVEGKFLGVDFNKLHHIITPTAEYRYIHAPSISSASLQQFDDIDSIGRKNEFSLGIENRLQTKRLVDGQMKTWDLGYFLLHGDYLYKPGDGSKFATVKADLELTPFSWLRIESDTQYDPASKDFQSWNADLCIDKADKWKLGFGSRYWQDTEHELTSEFSYKLNNEWAFRLFGRYDLKEVESDGHKIVNKFSNKEIAIIKDLHCWIGEISLDIDRDGGATVWFTMKLKASPKAPFDFSNYYARPKQ
ncbi:MAG: LPS assembly protein LptD [Candidatus Omnitrophica bacterium]|nr:LPS assembly protein LptD [Candidatus Omnitrophota bacterium]